MIYFNYYLNTICKYINPSLCDIYYFGTAETTPEERYELLKKYDTTKDYTYYRTEEENKKSCADIVSISKQLKEQCAIYNLPYYDTTYNREQIFNYIRDFLASNKD